MSDKPILCIFHGKCADGFTAAWVVHNSMPDVEFHAGVYGNPPPDVTDRHVLIVDYSYKRDVLEEMAKVARSITVLDHHKTAAADLYGYKSFANAALWIDSINDGLSGISTVFDMGRSGAGITWDFFHPNMPRPLLVDYVEDRDLWKFAMPQSREVAAYIFSHDYSFEKWLEIARELQDPEQLGGVLRQGEALERKHFKDIRELVGVTKRRMRIGGVEVWVANLPYTLASDAANMLAEGEPFGACYYDKDGGRVFSLRSKPDGADVSAIAAGYGGGGHQNASGFTAVLGWEGDHNV